MREPTRAIALLAAVLVLGACGGGGDGAADPVADPSASPTASVSVSGTPTPGTTGKPAKTPKPTATASATATGTPTATGAATKTPKPSKSPKPAFKVAMPDGRTTPLGTDFKFTNLKLDNRFLGATIATVDVTYAGPGVAGMAFTVDVTYTANGKGPDGKTGKTTTQYQGTVTDLTSGKTESVRLSGGDPKLYMDDGSPYDGKYTVTSVQDGDPQARVE